MADLDNNTAISTQELLDSNTLARGLAILAVIGCHIPFTHPYWKPLWVFASAGKLAVAVFLFSSGLLLHVSLNRAEGRLQIGPWLKRRFWRIYPVYWMGLAFTLLCAWLWRGRTFDLITILANVTGIPMWLHQKVISCGYTAPFWFISLLLLCYGLFLLFHRVRRKGWLLAGALILSFWALCTGGIMEAAVLAFPAFFAGVAMADRLQQRGAGTSDVRVQAAVFLPLLGFLIFVFKGRNFFHLGAGFSTGLDMAACVGFAAIPWSALQLVAYLQKRLAQVAPAVLRGLLWVSGLTFALFCIHEPLLVVLDKASAAGHPWFGLLAYGAIALAAAWALDALDRKIRRAE